MYFIFKPDPRYRDDGELAATLATYRGSADDPVPDTDPYWWEATPLQVPLPPLTFAIDAQQPLLDNYDEASIFDLYSHKLITMLGAAGVQFETFPATVVDYRTWTPVTEAYAVFHLLEIYPVTDYAHKIGSLGGPLQRPFILSQERQDNPKLFFRMQERPSIVLVHQDLKGALEASGITGCRFLPIETERW